MGRSIQNAYLTLPAVYIMLLHLINYHKSVIYLPLIPFTTYVYIYILFMAPLLTV